MWNQNVVSLQHETEARFDLPNLKYTFIWYYEFRKKHYTL